MSTLTNYDLSFVLSRVPKDVRDLMKQGAMLGGGFVRATLTGEKPNDIDLFGESQTRLESWAKDLTLSRRARLHTTDNAYTVLAPPRHPVQFIHRWTFPQAVDMVHSFDFTIAQVGIWFNSHTEKFQSYCHSDFYSDLASRRLVYTAPERNEDAGGSLLRVRKFLRAGYRIDAVSLGRVIARLVMGVDEVNEAMKNRGENHLAMVLGGLLREVDPLTVVDGVDLVDEHEVDQ